MKLRNKIIILITLIVAVTGLLITVLISGIVVNAMRQGGEEKDYSIAKDISGRILSLIPLQEPSQAVTPLTEIMKQQRDIEYIFITDKSGKVFAHTFKGELPHDILSGNPLYMMRRNIEFIDTEKGYIKDIGVKIHGNEVSELHIGIKVQWLKDMLQRIRSTAALIILFFVLISLGIAVFMSRLITEPLSRLVEFTKTLAAKEQSGLLDVKSNDEVGELAKNFNAVLMRLKSAGEKMQEAYTYTHLLQAEKLSSIGQISAGLAHELKNPVTTLKMLRQSFQDENDITKEDFDVIYSEIEKIENILAEFLNFIKQKDLNITEVNLNYLIERVLSLSAFDIQRYGIKVKTKMPDGILSIRADRALLEQVFLNLILNAVHAMPNGGEILISGRMDGSFAAVNITDKGQGIPYNIKSKIFDPFFTTKKAGTGLGLSIVYNIVSAHGGKISFESHEGIGTVFTVKLPVRVRG